MKPRKIEIELGEDDEVLERDIKEFGTACHIIIPLKHKGKKAKVIVKKEKGK